MGMKSAAVVWSLLMIAAGLIVVFVAFLIGDWLLTRGGRSALRKFDRRRGPDPQQ